jgi:hypothetical protein
MKWIKRSILIAGILTFSYSCINQNGINSCNEFSNTVPVQVPTIVPIPEDEQSDRANEEREGMETGNEIIAAIEIYYQTIGSYPKALEDLVPCLIQAIPSTKTGQSYTYLVKTEDNPFWPYILSFKGDSGTWGCAYHAKYQSWECGMNPSE